MTTMTKFQQRALMAAKAEGEILRLFRGASDLKWAHVPAHTLLALEAQGLVTLIRHDVEVYSRSGLYYKGRRLRLDAAVLTDEGKRVRAELLAAR